MILEFLESLGTSRYWLRVSKPLAVEGIHSGTRPGLKLWYVSETSPSSEDGSSDGIMDMLTGATQEIC